MEQTHGEFAFDLTSEILKSAANTNVVLILIFKTKHGEHLCTITHVQSSVEASDNALEFVETYVQNQVHRISCVFTATDTYLVTLMQYLPKQQKLRRKLEGEIHIEVGTRTDT